MSILAFDIGGSFIKYAWMEENGTILKSDKVPTPTTDRKVFYDQINKIYEMNNMDIQGVAFSIPGIFDSETGEIFAGGALEFNHGRNFFKDLEEFTSITDLPVTVENDAYCAALAEVWLGNLKDVQDGLVFILGSGVGGAIIKDQKVHKGKNNFAGEFSFTLNEGMLTKGIEESFALKASVPMFAKRVGAVKGDDSMTGEKAFDLINAQDPEVMPLFEDYVKNLGIFIFNMQSIYDPERILIGGGVSAQPILLHALQEFLEEIYKMIPLDMPKIDLGTCRHFNDSNLYGALYHYLVEEGVLTQDN